MIFNNIFLWHGSENINKEISFTKFQLIPISCLQVVHEYVHWHCSIDYCVKLIVVDKTFTWKVLLFHSEIICAYFLWEHVLLWGELQIDAKKNVFVKCWQQVNFFKILKNSNCHCHIWIQHEKCIQMSTNKPSIGSVFPGISLCILRKYCEIVI